MRRISAWILAIAVVTGVAAAATAYARTSPGLPDAPSTPTAAASAVRQQSAPAPRPAKPVTRWAPCPTGTRLEGGACVREVVRTVVLPAAPAPAPRTAPAPAARAGQQPAPATAAASPASPRSAATAAAPAGEHEDGDEGGQDNGAGEHDD